MSHKAPLCVVCSLMVILNNHGSFVYVHLRLGVLQYIESFRMQYDAKTLQHIITRGVLPEMDSHLSGDILDLFLYQGAIIPVENSSAVLSDEIHNICRQKIRQESTVKCEFIYRIYKTQQYYEST